ncbi:MAG: DUF6029 family protein [Myxococcales bacterium]|nr:DUF6029 family protein [Polyangiaceae bacterium]MDW8251330.1 DUF6029 family protein [Myxococcales bacterium]
MVGSLLRRTRSVRGGFVVFCLVAPTWAQEFGGFRFLITETSIINYRIDNRDADLVNDNYGEWLNRLNLQASRGQFTAQLRLDSALYFLKPNPNILARKQADAQPEAIAERATIDGVSLEEARAAFLAQQTLAFGRNLSTRYNNTFFPSKLAVTYARQGLEVTLGDFYIQFGRGMVLALRKADELATDTTLRGAKLDYRPDLGQMRLNVVLLAGYTNPLRVDEVSGRQLTQRDSGLEGVVFPLAPAPRSTFYLPDARPSFATDRILGGRIEHGVREVQVSLQSAYLTRTNDFYERLDLNAPTRSVREVINSSVGINIPNLADHGSFYAEGALQKLEDPYLAAGTSPEFQREQRAFVGRLSGGKALYGLLTLFKGPVTVNFEGKHYDRFYPMMASVSQNTAEFLPLQYNGVPTTEPIWSDVQYNAFNACVTGGRLRADVKANQRLLVFASLGGYVSYSERVATCGQQQETDDEGNVLPPRGKSTEIRNVIWDPWVGFEWNAADNRSHIYASGSSRWDHTSEPEIYAGLEEPTRTFYREYYHIRYDAVAKVSGPWSLQTAGFHRHRFKPEQKSTPWFEGENYLSLLYAPKLTLAFGYEYTTVFGYHKNYFNGQILYRHTTDTILRLFAGQSRPALRCVSGVCRQFPAFEGLKLEAVLRF